MLIIICGLPGSGKSTIARALAKNLGADYINSDIIRKRMFRKPTYTKKEKEAVYREMAAKTENSLRSGNNAVVDATFYLSSTRDMFLDIARNASTRAFIILCKLGKKETIKRLNRRTMESISDADYNVYLKLKSEFEPIKEPHLEVDGSRPKEELVKQIIGYVGILSR